VSIIAIIIAVITAILSIFSSAATESLEPAERGRQVQVVAPPTPPPEWPTSFEPFDCGWVRDELVDRNVRPVVADFLMMMVERESQCCPFIQGGDRVDGNCQVTHVARWDHRSDTGLFMINGVHYKTEKGMSCPEFTCDQDVLRRDIGMQFDVMLELYAECGERPWTAPSYGCSPDWPYVALDSSS
tara:strand:- start:229 stop:786 length:558 start_codon:yes stop_codon:yes gene_type:complete